MPKAERVSDTSVLDAALCYAARGWLIFPAQSSGDKKSHKSAKLSNGRAWGKTNNPDEIRRDFAKWPRANVGIATGSETGLFVVETDTPEGHDVDGIASLNRLEAKFGRLPDTLMAESPSGSVHYYFKYPLGLTIKNSESKLGPGIDVRGEGGMVLAPPSVRPGKGSYRWLNQLLPAEAPAWLIERASNASPHEAKPQNEDRQLYTDRDLAVAAVAIIPNTEEVDRSDWITVGLAIHGATGGKGFDIFDAWSRRHPTYNQQDTIEAWKGFKPKKIGAGTLFHLANEACANWQDPNDAKSTAIIQQFVDELSEPMSGAGSNHDGGHHNAHSAQAIPSQPSQSISPPTMQHYSGKVVTRKQGSGRKERGEEPNFRIELLNGAALTPRKQEWLWPGRIPRVTLSLLIGLPDMGKSHIFLRCLRSDDDVRRGLDLTQDVQRIEACLNNNPEIALIVFDPISEFLGAKFDGHSNTAVRAVLGQLMDLLDKRNIAALGVSHLPKVKTGMVQTASIGSIGFSACARSSLLVVDEEEDVVDEADKPTGERELTGRKLLTVNKGNLAAPEDRETLVLRLEAKTLDHPHDDITVARVKWEGVKQVTARELWQDHKPKQQQGKQKSDAIQFIKDAMRDPENRAIFRDRLSTEIEARAAAAGISASTLKRAKAELGVRSQQKKGTGEWWWIAPDNSDWGPGF